MKRYAKGPVRVHLGGVTFGGNWAWGLRGLLGDYWGSLWFSSGVAHCRGGLVAIFRGSFAGIGGFFGFAGGLAAGLSVDGV